MKKLVKKILTDKKSRNLAMLTTFMMSVAAVGAPWSGLD